MKFLHLIALLLMCTFSLAEIKSHAYRELKKLNATCPNDRSCETFMSDRWSSKCHCGDKCSFFGTCCLDSKHSRRPRPKLKPRCRYIGGEDFGYSFLGCSFTFAGENLGYYMIDQCPTAKDGSISGYEDLCTEEWSGQNDVMRIVPVTSLFTQNTYKNFFCFRCHESNDNYVFWNVKAKFNGETDRKAENIRYFQLMYDGFYETWVAPIGKRGSFVAVDLVIEKPVEAFDLTPWCYPSLISKCSEDWKDYAVRAKCAKYMYVVNIKRSNQTLLYRNPHCALCNYENLEDMYCPTALHDEGWTHTSKKPFSFTFLLDVNQADGGKVGQIERCRGGDIWDPYFKQCRTSECILPGYTVKGGKCVAP